MADKKYTVQRFLVLCYSICLFFFNLSLSSFALAKTFDEEQLENNTGYCVVWQNSSDGVVNVNSGWAHQHLYGQLLLLDLYVSNLHPQKTIKILQLNSTGSHMDEAFYRSDWWNVEAAADWRFTTNDSRDNIWVLKKTNFARGNYRVEVMMNGQTHSVVFRLDSCGP